MNPLGHVAITVAALLALTLSPSARAGGPSMLVGVAEDSVRSADPTVAQKQMDLLQQAGFRAVRITDIWAPGETVVTKADATVLDNVFAAAKKDGIVVFVSLLNYGSRTTPLSDSDQADFASYAASLVATAHVRFLIVGNEPNLNRYWLPQFDANGDDAAAPAYESLLAKTYDAVKAVSPSTQVIGGALAPRGGDDPTSTRQTHSPTLFLEDMGAAYRASGRTKPIMDAVSLHPYEDHSNVAPADGTHPNTTTIALADYPKLVSVLGNAFDGTAQAGSSLPIYYDEFGVETQIPPAKQALYTGAEPAVTQPVDEATQAAYYRQAIALAFCYPNLRGLFLFHSVDEKALSGWQSGVYYADDTPKTSLAGVKLAIEQQAGGVIATCQGMVLTPKVTVTQRGAVLTLRCSLDCNYVAQLYRVPGRLLVSKRGRAIAGRPTTLPLRVPVVKGSYRLRLSAAAAANAGAPVLLRQALKPG